MVGMTIGAVLILFSLVVYRQNLSDYQKQEQSVEMMENVRAALYFMQEDLEMAGFFGPITDPSVIDDSDVNLTIVQDCGTATAPDTWALHDRTPFSYLLPTSAAAANTAFPCISSAEFQTNNPVLAIKRVASTSSATCTLYNTCLRAKSASGELFRQTATTPAPAAGETIWPYIVNVYYIRNYDTTSGDNIPSLYRTTLQVAADNTTNMVTETGGIGENIEFFRLMFGIDSDTDGFANYFTSDPTGQYANIAAVRVYFLVRSSSQFSNVTNDKTYTLGDFSTTATGDGYLRRVFTTTIHTRNIINTRELSE